MRQGWCTLLALAVGVVASAQSGRDIKEIRLRNGQSVQWLKGQVDSVRAVYTPEGDTLGLKVYVEGRAQDFLHSQWVSVDYYQPTVGENVNRNSATDLAKNAEGWRLEFPRFYQGTNRTYEVTHSTTQYGITYSLEWDGDLRANRWTCYELHAGNTLNNVSRQDNFRQDPEVPSQYQTTLSDYKGSGFSRGHLCPSGDRLCSQEQNGQTFYLTNMQPQWQRHNGGLWQQLETYVRNVADNFDTLYVVKAATIDQPSQVYTTAEVAAQNSSFDGVVPRYFYMALLGYRKSANQYTAMGIWTVHENRSVSLSSVADYAITIDELEKRTGIDFFCNLPDNIEQAVESKVQLSDWPSSTRARKKPSIGQ